MVDNGGKGAEKAIVSPLYLVVFIPFFTLLDKRKR
jgi:hypothetical protein